MRLANEMKYLLRKYRRAFEALEEYDNSRKLPADRVRVDITLARRTLEKLRRLKQRTGKAISRIVEEAVNAIEVS